MKYFFRIKQIRMLNRNWSNLVNPTFKKMPNTDESVEGRKVLEDEK